MNERYGYVYKITNTVNNKIYVGKRTSRDFDEQYWGGGKIIHAAILKYGKSNFIREILEWCSSKDELEQRERFWIQELNARDLSIGYNLAEGGEGGITYVGENPRKGQKLNLSEESRKRLSEAHIGLLASEETKQKMSNSRFDYWENHPEQREYYKRYFTENNGFKGKHHTQDSIDIIRLKNKGKEPWNKGKTGCYSEETRYAMGCGMRGKEPWHKGKTGCYSAETIEKLRESHTGKKQSPETIEKRVLKIRGRHQSEETRQKISEKNLGRRWTEEQKLMQKQRMKQVEYNITCKTCGARFVSHSSATRYCSVCKKEKQ